MNKIITILIIFCLTIPVFAETIVLRSGKTVEGKIIEDTDSYIKLETIDGQSLYFYKNTIDTIKIDNGITSSVLADSNMKTGLLDYSDKGYMLFVPKDMSTVAPILVCLPGWGIKTKQDINNWAFTAGKKGFVVLGLDVDYDRINSLSDVDALYSRMYAIIGSLASEYSVNQNKIYVVGTSAGGMISISLALRYPKSFVAIGVVSGGRLGFGAQEELKNAKGCRLYMVHGDKDEKIPIGEFQSTRKQLERNGAIIEYNIISGGRHTLNSNAYKEVVNWLSDLDTLAQY
jgi:predicted esterase